MRAIHTVTRASLFVLVVSLCPALAWAQGETEEAPPPAAATPLPSATTPGEPAATATVAAQPVEAPQVLIGLGVGAYFPTSDLGPNFVVGIDAAYQLPLLERKLGIGAALAYSQPGTDGTISDTRVPGGSAGYESTMQELALDFFASFRFLSWDSWWSPHVAVGPVLYFLSHDVEALRVDQSETSTEVGFLGRVGVDFRVWHGAVTVDVRIPFATVDQRTTGDSNVGAVSVLAGYRFRL